MSENIVESLSNYITQSILKQPGRSLSPSTALISSGLVDSFSLVDLAMFVEQEFGVRIDDTELNADTFDSLSDLAALVDSRR
jgi:acyl carrier protein